MKRCDFYVRFKLFRRFFPDIKIPLEKIFVMPERESSSARVTLFEARRVWIASASDGKADGWYIRAELCDAVGDMDVLHYH